MTKSRRQGMAGSILEQFAELKSDYEIGKASRYKRAKTGIMTLGSHADLHELEMLTLQHVIIDGDICSLPNRDGGVESQEGHRLKTPRNTTKNVVHACRRRRQAGDERYGEKRVLDLAHKTCSPSRQAGQGSQS